MANKDNPARGAAFEKRVRDYFESQEGVVLQRDFTIGIGVGQNRGAHKFDLGALNPPILVECKCHKWTEGGNAPSAKLSVWNEAMLYFLAAPKKYRKLLFVQKSVRNGQSLAEYYRHRYSHMVPEGVEIWELSDDDTATKLWSKRKGPGVPPPGPHAS